jgi:hypothetical protein
VAPPLVGVAVKVVVAPEQMDVALAAILTEGAVTAVVLIVMPLDVAVGVVIQLASEVSSQVITSPFAKLDDE